MRRFYTAILSLALVVLLSASIANSQTYMSGKSAATSLNSTDTTWWCQTAGGSPPASGCGSGQALNTVELGTLNTYMIAHGGLALISTQTPTVSTANCGSSIACMAWTGLSGYSYYQMLCYGVGGAVSSYMQFGESSGPTWEVTGYSNETVLYQYAATTITGIGGSASDVGISGIVNGPSTIVGILGGQVPLVTGSIASASSTGVIGIGGGTYNTDTTAKTAIRIEGYTSGSPASLTTGTCTLWGLAS